MVRRRRGMTVADALVAIDELGVTVGGEDAAPIVWDSTCTWPTCGTCMMLINGTAAAACMTRVEDVAPGTRKLTLEPLRAFEVIADLSVDRSRMRDDAIRAGALLAPNEDEDNLLLGAFLRCTRCGACVDACPEAHPRASFVGPYAIGAVHATRALEQGDVPAGLLRTGGIADCGHVQNCVAICPELVPLDDAISGAAKTARAAWLKRLFRRG